MLFLVALTKEGLFSLGFDGRDEILVVDLRGLCGESGSVLVKKLDGVLLKNVCVHSGCREVCLELLDLDGELLDLSVKDVDVTLQLLHDFGRVRLGHGARKVCDVVGEFRLLHDGAHVLS